MKNRKNRKEKRFVSSAKALTAAGIMGILALGTFGCSKPGTVIEREGGIQTIQEEVIYPSVDELDLDFSKRDVNYSYDEKTAVKVDLSDYGIDIDGEGATADKTTLTITKAGTYVLSGELSDGEVVVDAGDEDKIQVVLNDVEVNNEDGPAFLVQNADKVFLTLAENSMNILSDAGEEYALEADDNCDAVVFSHDDLTINGEGSLTVLGQYKHGIVSKDDLVLFGATIDVSAKEDAIQGNDCVKAMGVTMELSAGDDAIKSDQFIYFRNGSVNVTSCYEGYEAVKVIIDDGEHYIMAEDDAINASLPSDSTEATSKTDSDNKAVISVERAEKDFEDEFSQQKGRMARDPNEAPGDIDPTQKHDKMMPRLDANDNADTMDGLPENVPEPDEEGTDPHMKGIRGDKFDDGEFVGGGFGKDDMAQTSDACLILINGGDITVSGRNDGLDSNGSIEINGGNIIVCGPNNGMDGAIDFDLSATINGGTVLMTGSIASRKGFSESEQPYAIVSASGKKGSVISLIGDDDEIIAEMTATIAFENVFVSSSLLGEGSKFVMEVDGTAYDGEMEKTQ